MIDRSTKFFPLLPSLLNRILSVGSIGSAGRWVGGRWIGWSVSKWSVVGWSVVGGSEVGKFNKTHLKLTRYLKFKKLQRDYRIFSSNALRDLVPFVPFKKREKHPWWIPVIEIFILHCLIVTNEFCCRCRIRL